MASRKAQELGHGEVVCAVEGDSDGEFGHGEVLAEVLKEAEVLGNLWQMSPAISDGGARL
jgi:hypothetical protein